MTRVSIATLLCATLLATGAAYADTTYTVDKVTITGSKTVPAQTLLDSLSIHKGSHVTQADIVAGQDEVYKALKSANVVGGIKTGMRSLPKNHVEVIYMIDDQGAQAPTVTKVAPKLHAETFAGNVTLSSDALTAASGLTRGEELSNEKIQAAQKAIIEAYKTAKKPIDVVVSGSNTSVGNGQVDVLWTIAETKSKPKQKKDERSQEAQDQIQ